MSRIGKKPVDVPAGVTVSVSDNVVTVKGPNGQLDQPFHADIEVKVDGNVVSVNRKNNGRVARGMHGLVRTLISNMVQGVVKPYRKSLEIHGVGYRAEMVGNAVRMQVGLSHEVLHPMPDGIKATIDKQTIIHLDGIDKALVGQVAAALRAYRPCEPYKGKGVKYVGERIRRKEGKTGAS